MALIQPNLFKDCFIAYATFAVEIADGQTVLSSLAFETEAEALAELRPRVETIMNGLGIEKPPVFAAKVLNTWQALNYNYEKAKRQEYLAKSRTSPAYL